MNRSILIVTGVLLLVLVLAGAAFVGAQMLSRPAEAVATGGSGRVLEVINDTGSGPVSLRLLIEPAPELPDRPLDVGGVFLRREDNSIFVGTGNLELDVDVNGDTGEATVNLSSDGPEVEVVVTQDTIIYRDETEISSGGPEAGRSEERTIQQVVRPVDSLEEVNTNSEVQVWGQRRGDRIVAEVLVYRIVSAGF